MLSSNLGNFESRIKRLSGNKQFQIQNLSPEIQGIIKKYLNSRAKDQWEDLGSVIDSEKYQTTELYTPFRRTIFQHSPEEQINTQEVFPPFLGDTLQIVKINTDTIKREQKSPPKSNFYSVKPTKKNLPPLNQLMKRSSNPRKQCIFSISLLFFIFLLVNQYLQSEIQQDQLKNQSEESSFFDYNQRKQSEAEKKHQDSKQMMTIFYPIQIEGYVGISQPQSNKKISNHNDEKEETPEQINKMKTSKQFKFKQPRSQQQPQQNKPKTSIPKQFKISNDLLPLFKDPRFPKDVTFKLKYALYRENLNQLNIKNYLYVHTPAPTNFPIYKCYVSIGNNGLVVKQVLKQRWWWSSTDNKDEIAQVNFAWTQLRQQLLLENLPKKKKQEESASTAMNNSLDESDMSNKKNKKKIYVDPTLNKCHNHLENNFHLGNKKALFYNLRNYYKQQKLDVFRYIPITFHIKGPDDKFELQKLTETFEENQGKNIWIVKPGEDSNRGNGIKICTTMEQIYEIVQSGEKHKNGSLKTYIVQSYIDRPFLYHKRKFDIRCFMLMTSINGYQKGYWYQDGYVRTSSKEFSIKNLQNRYIHLTNDAVQKKGDSYGKYEKGNKVSFEDFDKFVNLNNGNFQDIYVTMKNSSKDALKSVYEKIDPFRRENSFELFGLDFMVDENLKVWLIEVNTNPCLETSSPLMFKIIPTMLDNLFKLVLDPLYPCPQFYNPKRLIHENNENNKFELIFDEQEDGVNYQSNDDDFGQIIEESDEDSIQD